MANRNTRPLPFMAIRGRPEGQGPSLSSQGESDREAPPKVIVGGAQRFRWLVRFQHSPEGPQVVTAPQLRLGTDADNDIVLHGYGVAPLHCTVRREGSLIRLYDHGSLLGTLADGQTVHEPTILHGTARLLLGHQEITIRALDPPPSTDSLRSGFLPTEKRQRPPRAAPRAPQGRQCRGVPGLRWQLPAFFAMVVGTAGITQALLTGDPENSRSLAPGHPPRPRVNHAASRSAADSPPSWSTLSPTPHASHNPERSRRTADSPADGTPASPLPRVFPDPERSRSAAESPSTKTALSLLPHIFPDPERSRRGADSPANGTLSPLPHASPSAESTLPRPAPPHLQAPSNRAASGPSLLAGDPLGSHRETQGSTYSRDHRVEYGETWASIADRQGIPRTHLRAANNGLRRPLREGDRLRVPGFAQEPTLSGAMRPSCGDTIDIPSGAHSVGGVTTGSLDNPIRMPKLDLYELRCPRHSYTTAATARGLIDAIACFREHRRYAGEIVIGDISRECGGSLGPHRSHQSGRDVDLWLPIAGGRYGRGCDHCGTDFCRPEPHEIDWHATWALVQALAARPEIEVVFLDFDLQAKLRRSALESGADPASLDAAIQWPRRGAPTLVQHSAGHVHHMHIRFRCPPDDPSCDPRPPTASAARTRQKPDHRPREHPLLSTKTWQPVPERPSPPPLRPDGDAPTR